MTDNDTYQNESTEELLDLARANAQAVVIATAAFLQQAGIPAVDWTGYLGSLFANSWDDSARGDAGAFLKAALTNYRAFGAEVISSVLERNRSEALISGFPHQDLCAELQADCSLAQAFFDVPAAIADGLDLTWEWSTEDERTRLVVARKTT